MLTTDPPATVLSAPGIPASPVLRVQPAQRFRRIRMAVALYRANAADMLRDPMTVLMTSLVPLLFLAIYGIAFHSSGNPSLKLGLVVTPRSTVAQALERELRTVPGVKVTLQYSALASLRSSMKAGNLDGIVILPTWIDAALHGGVGTATLIYDPARQSQAGLLQSVVQQAAADVDRVLTGHRPLLAIAPVPFNGTALDPLSYAMPSILAITLIQLGVMGTVIPLVQLRQNGVLRQFGTTPLPRSVLAASQIAWRLTMALAQVIILIYLGHLVLGVAVVGNWLQLILVTVLGGLVFISLGYLLAARARTGESANGIATIAFMPLIFLGGLFIPLELGPSWMKTVSMAVPTTYLGDALRQVLAGATPLYSLTVDCVVLAAFLVVISGAAIRLFQWE